MTNQKHNPPIRSKVGRWRLTRRRTIAVAILCVFGVGTWLAIRGTIRDRREGAARRERLANATAPGHVLERTVRPGWIKRFSFLDDADVGETQIIGLNLRHVDEVILCDLETLSELDQLHLCYAEPPITDADLQHLSGLKKLTLLRLTNAHIEGEGLRHLQGLTQLRQLWLDGTPLQGEGLQYLSNLKRLQVLLLSDSAIDDAGMQHLTGPTNLPLLSLNRTSVGDAGLEPISRLQGLHALSLAETRVTDAGLVHLTGLPITQLNLRGTQVSDAGLEQIARLQYLEGLDLRDTQVTAEGVRALQTSLPNCRIAYGDAD